MFNNSKTLLLAQSFSMILKFCSNIILAYILSPKDFGLMALIVPVIIGLQLFSEVGINASLIRSHNGENKVFKRTAYTLNAIRGIGLFVIATLLADIFANLYDAESLKWLLIVAALTLIFKGLKSVEISISYRNGIVGLPVKLELLEQLISIIVTIILALYLKSTWALVIGMVVGSLSAMFLSHFTFNSKIFNFGYDRPSINEIFHFGKWIFIVTCLTFLAGQFDRFYLGDKIGLDELGVYFIAITLASMPNEIMQKLAVNVIYPSYSKFFREEKSVREYHFTKQRIAILFVTLFLCGSVIAFSFLFFELAYSDSYTNAWAISSFYSLTIWFCIAQTTLDRAILASGNSKAVALIAGLSFIMKLIFGILGFELAQLFGFIFGLAIGSMGPYALVLFWCKRHLELSLRYDLLFGLLLTSLLGFNMLLLHYFQLSYLGSFMIITLFTVTLLYLFFKCFKNEAYSFLRSMQRV